MSCKHVRVIIALCDYYYFHYLTANERINILIVCKFVYEMNKCETRLSSYMFYVLHREQIKSTF